MSKVVLITGIGGDISQGVATILRECRPGLRLVGVDTHPDHGGRLFVDSCEIVPVAHHPSYRSALDAVIVRHGVDVVIPMSEPELGELRAVNSSIPDVKWVTAGERAVAVGLDKLATIKALEGLGLPVPWTVPVGEGLPFEYPCVLKNRCGSGSRAVFKIENDEDAAYFSKRHPCAIFQELLEPADREITCAVYRNRSGDIASLLMLRRLTGGFTGWARVIHDVPTADMCARIAAGLELRGSMNVQLRLTDKGPRVFEINPRFSSTVLMRHRLGYRDVLWAMDEVEGRTVTYPEIASDKIMVRVQAAAIFEGTQEGVRQ